MRKTIISLAAIAAIMSTGAHAGAFYGYGNLGSGGTQHDIFAIDDGDGDRYQRGHTAGSDDRGLGNMGSDDLLAIAKDAESGDDLYRAGSKQVTGVDFPPSVTPNDPSGGGEGGSNEGAYHGGDGGYYASAEEAEAHGGNHGYREGHSAGESGVGMSGNAAADALNGY